MDQHSPFLTGSEIYWHISLDQGFFNCLEGLFKHKLIASSHLQIQRLGLQDVFALGWGLRIGIANKLLGDAD